MLRLRIGTIVVVSDPDPDPSDSEDTDESDESSIIAGTLRSSFSCAATTVASLLLVDGKDTGGIGDIGTVTLLMGVVVFIILKG